MRSMVMLVCLALAVARFVASEETSQPPAGQPKPPPIRRIGPHLYQVGTVTLDAAKRLITCPGRVNMAEGGPIEVLACLPKGKVHESVFVLDVAPKDLQVALLLLGLKEGRNPAVTYPIGGASFGSAGLTEGRDLAVTYPEDSPERGRPVGDKVLISVRWRIPADGEGKPSELKQARAEQFLHNVQTDQIEKDAQWVFLGSTVEAGRFGADMDGTLVTTYHDPLAILELCLPTVNDDIYYYVNEKLSPPAGTAVELLIEAPPAEGQGAGKGQQEVPSSLPPAGQQKEDRQ